MSGYRRYLKVNRGTPTVQMEDLGEVAKFAPCEVTLEGLVSLDYPEEVVRRDWEISVFKVGPREGSWLASLSVFHAQCNWRSLKEILCNGIGVKLRVSNLRLSLNSSSTPGANSFVNLKATTKTSITAMEERTPIPASIVKTEPKEEWVLKKEEERAVKEEEIREEEEERDENTVRTSKRRAATKASSKPKRKVRTRAQPKKRGKALSVRKGGTKKESSLK